MAEQLVDQVRTSMTDAAATEQHLVERLDRVQHEVAELRQVVAQLEIHLRYLWESEYSRWERG